MCGIAGWIDPEGSIRADVDAIRRALHHRGPDSSGTESTHLGSMVHTRLKVLDLTNAGSQPAWSHDGSVCIVFNGEIYNHRQLRQELGSKGYSFRGHSDTEVIAPLYLEYGDQFVDHLRGMFAIGVLDLRAHRLVLVRDRFGIKPLFWGRARSVVAFASELPALRQIEGIDLAIDAQAIHDYVALHHIPPPQTIHRGVRSLEPGSILTAEWTSGRMNIKVRPYHAWSLATTPSLVGVEAAVETVGCLLDRAVGSQLESDVPLATMLSGGIDSGLISQAAHRQTSDGVRSFGVSFDDPEFDERPAFEAAARSIGCDHRTLSFGEIGSSWQEISAILLACGQPFADSSILAVDALAQLLREHVTVALSGDGGDEGFAGYDHFGRLYGIAPVLGLPGRTRRASLQLAAYAASAVSPILGTWLPHQLPSRLKDLANTSSLSDVVADQTSWVRAAEQARWWIGPPVDASARLFEPKWETSGDHRSITDRLFDVMTEADIRIRLAGDFLPKVDTASMRHSLEVRVPMLDEDLFAFGLALPRRLKRPRQGPGKLILRRLAAERLPVIASLPKHGFGVPFDKWVGDDFRDVLADRLGRNALVHDWLDPAITAPLVDAFLGRRGPAHLTRQGLYQRVLMLVALEIHLDALRA